MNKLAFLGVYVLLYHLVRQKIDPALIARFRPAMFGCFWPIFFFADHRCRERRGERRRRPCAECGKRPRAFGLEWCRECYEQIKPVDGSLGFSLRTAPQRPHDVEVDLASIWGNPDAVIAAVRDALAAAGIDPGDFLEAARPAADEEELLITCRAWVHVDVGGRASAQ